MKRRENWRRYDRRRGQHRTKSRDRRPPPSRVSDRDPLIPARTTGAPSVSADSPRSYEDSPGLPHGGSVARAPHPNFIVPKHARGGDASKSGWGGQRAVVATRDRGIGGQRPEQLTKVEVATQDRASLGEVIQGTQIVRAYVNRKREKITWLSGEYPPQLGEWKETSPQWHEVVREIPPVVVERVVKQVIAQSPPPPPPRQSSVNRSGGGDGRGRARQTSSGGGSGRRGLLTMAGIPVGVLAAAASCRLA